MIAEFQGPYRFLSNFYPTTVIFNGDLYSTVEHAYQAAKTLDLSVRLCIRVANTPGEAKKRGRQAPLRADWVDVKLDVMLKLLRQKFSAGTQIGDQLLETRDRELVEGNTWGDIFWGVCEGRGENHLGKLLMQVRKEIQDDD